MLMSLIIVTGHEANYIFFVYNQYLRMKMKSKLLYLRLKIQKLIMILFFHYFSRTTITAQQTPWPKQTYNNMIQLAWTSWCTVQITRKN